MIRMYARHEVDDYGSWREGYDAFHSGPAAERGVQAHAVYRTVGNDAEVTLWHDFESADAAQAFVGSDELKAAMQAAGVKGQPDIWIVEED
ncbi:MAG: antibiotic biosynthesis monooxygenase [Solirubrobacterales bacterium]